MASFDSSVPTQQAQNIKKRTTKQAKAEQANIDYEKNWWSGYLHADTTDPRHHFSDYPMPLSRMGMWWKGYEDSYNKLQDATTNYGGDFNQTFNNVEPHLDTQGIQDEWGEYLGRLEGYYGEGTDRLEGLYAGFDEDFIDRDAYDLWGDLATGDNQSERVQDWYQQSPQGKYLADQANENFWRQAQLGGQTYNPQEVQNFINQQIVAPEAQQAFGNLANYGKLQADMGWNMTSAMGDMDRWYADAMARGDTYAQQQIADLMNQEQQQRYQHEMTQGLGNARLRYLQEGQMPAARTMDFTNQQIAHADAQALMRMAADNKSSMFAWLANASLPNAYDSFLWESEMYKSAVENQESALNAQLGASLAGSAMGAIGGMI